LATLGDRRIVIAREITKIHEEFIRGTARELFEAVSKRMFKGEATVLIEGRARERRPKDPLAKETRI
jgi:16S rRNA (cytidine1402-2'-O)-methyltransferase